MSCPAKHWQASLFRADSGATIEATDSARDHAPMSGKQDLPPQTCTSGLWLGILGEGVNNAAEAFENLRNSLLRKPNLA
jgi:hypothetical protein